MKRNQDDSTGSSGPVRDWNIWGYPLKYKTKDMPGAQAYPSPPIFPKSRGACFPDAPPTTWNVFLWLGLNISLASSALLQLSLPNLTPDFPKWKVPYMKYYLLRIISSKVLAVCVKVISISATNPIMKKCLHPPDLVPKASYCALLYEFFQSCGHAGTTSEPTICRDLSRLETCRMKKDRSLR